MNILTDTLPNELTVCGEICPIRSDFRTWIKFTQIMIISKNTDVSAVAEAFKLVFYKLPPRFDEAIAAMMEFYSPKKAESKAGGESSRKRIYDYDYDAELIYAAFMQQYRLDLTSAALHWWQFKALLDGLGEETQFVKVMQYRAMDLSRIKDKEQKSFYRKMKRIYRLPDNRTQEEREQGIISALEASFGW